MAQLMPLPLTVSCFSKIQIGFTFLVLAHLGSPGKRAIKRVLLLLLSHSSLVRQVTPWEEDICRIYTTFSMPISRKYAEAEMGAAKELKGRVFTRIFFMCSPVLQMVLKALLSGCQSICASVTYLPGQKHSHPACC